jgi:WD40 repeat protein
MAETNPGTNGRVFISYSRKDKAFVEKLNDALDRAGVQAWVDWKGIELASDWMETISDAIQGNDAFLFVISPDSLQSRICSDELELGLKLNKKLIPILYREPVKGSQMHEKLSSTNWVYLRDQDNFDDTIPRLIEAVNTDLGWVRQHTRLLEQALEWDQKSRNNSFLLNGTELEEAEKWLTDASGKSNRQVLPLQAEYISISRTAAIHRQRSLLIGVSLAAVISLAAAAIAIVQYFEANNQKVRAEQNAALAIANQQKADQNALEAETQADAARQAQARAEENERIARAERRAAQAQTLQSRPGELHTSTLLAIDSYQTNETFQAENLIRINTSRLAKPIAQMSQDGAVWNIEWSPDYAYFVTGNNHDPSDQSAVTEACVYHAGDGKILYCKQHDGDVNDALFTKDGRYLVTASADQTVRFWNAEDGELVQELKLGGAVLDLDVSDSVLAIAREDNFLTLYYLDKPDLKPLDVEQVDGVRTVEFSPSGDLLAFGLLNGQVKFWQARNNFFYNGPLHPKSSYAVLAWSPDNLWLASGGGDSTARLTQRDGTPRHTVKHQDWVEGWLSDPTRPGMQLHPMTISCA